MRISDWSSDVCSSDLCDATDPRQIPARGWWEVAKRVAEQLSSDHVPVVAAGVAFFSFLAIFPALAGFVILYGLVADPATVGDQLAPFRGLLAAEVFDLLATQIPKVSGAEDRRHGFGVPFSLSFAARWEGRSVGE